MKGNSISYYIISLILSILIFFCLVVPGLTYLGTLSLSAFSRQDEIILCTIAGLCLLVEIFFFSTLKDKKGWCGVIVLSMIPFTILWMLAWLFQFGLLL